LVFMFSCFTWVLLLDTVWLRVLPLLIESTLFGA
jgi:hypothetical protein